MDPIIAFVIAAACALIGLFFGMIIASTSNKTPRSAKPPQESLPSVVEIARLFSNENGTKPLLQVKGNFLHSPESLKPRQRQFLIQLLKQLLTWLGVTEAGMLAGDSRVSTEIQRQTIPGGTPTRPLSGGFPADAGLPALHTMETSARTTELKATIPIEQKSIVAQVEEILQSLLAGTPLEKTGIHLIEMPGTDILITVGLNQYHGIDEIPDEQIRQVIRLAVKQWEKSLGK